MSLDDALTIVGCVLLVVGVGFVYWPAALIVAGALLMVAGVTIGLNKRG